jgi:hypothetical protein
MSRLKATVGLKVPQGTAFEDLPLNWRCPVCSVPKKRFANIGPGQLALWLQGKFELWPGRESVDSWPEKYSNLWRFSRRVYVFHQSLRLEVVP